MAKMKFINGLLITAMLLCAVVAAVWFALSRFMPQKDVISVGAGRMGDIETMAQLCTVDFYNEVPICDTIYPKVCFAIQKQRGSISFDLEKLEIDTVGDTIKITLPPEIVQLFEATEKDSWQVIDSKDLRWYNKWSEATPDDWRKVKARAKARSIKKLYRDGVVRRARAEAARNLEDLMTKVYRKPVTVIDPTPQGAHYRQYTAPDATPHRAPRQK